MRILGASLVLLAACGNSGQDSGGGGGGGDGGDDDDVAMPDAPAPPKPVKFIAVGDTGKGNADQRRVAIAMRDLCAAKGCDFVLMLGDNIYDAGVTSTTDSQWQTKFEQPYMDVNLPFYVALGNHDYGGKLLIDIAGIGNEFDKGKVEVDYTQVSMKWNMPATHYTFTYGDVGFIVLDTNSILWSDTTYGDQAAWLPSALAEVSGKRWVFTAGHHPYLSNGQHGNAGDYDAPELAGISIPNPLPIQNGAALKSFFDQNVCGISQAYICGHDHSRQWINEPTALCGTEMIISGAGSSVSSLQDRGNQSFYEDATKVGFMYVVIDGDKFTGQFYDADGALDYERTFMHP
ncbi:MAG TPA: metallophosphoesterase [Kofleriaceae bacterium]|nr:metallophosphoesterase [Kofleriaceae bacterium]